MEPCSILQAIDEAVKLEPAPGAGRVPSDDWQGWDIVLSALGADDARLVANLAREAVGKEQQPAPGEATVEPWDGGGPEGRAALAFVPVGMAAYIIRELQPDTEELLYEVWCPSRAGTALLTETHLRAKYGGAADGMLSTWQETRDGPSGRVKAQGAVESFNPAGVRALLLAASATLGAGGDTGQPPAAAGLPAADRLGRTAAASSPRQPAPRYGLPEDAPNKEEEGPQRQRLRLWQAAVSEHLDDHHPNRSYCDPEAATALWRTFTQAFMRVWRRKRQAALADIVLARHSSVYATQRAAPRPPGRRHQAAAAEEEEQEDDDVFDRRAEVAPTRQQHRQQWEARDGCRAGGTAAAAAAVGAGAQENAEELGDRGGGTGRYAVMGDDAVGEEGATRPQQRQRGVIRRREPVEHQGSDGGGGSPAQPEAVIGQRRRWAAAPRAAASPQTASSGAATQVTAHATSSCALRGTTVAESPTRWSSATSAGKTISDLGTASPQTPHQAHGWQLPVPAVEGEGTDEAPDRQAQGEQLPLQPQYHPTIVPDARAEAAWRRLGRVLRTCRAAMLQAPGSAAGGATAPSAQPTQGRDGTAAGDETAAPWATAARAGDALEQAAAAAEALRSPAPAGWPAAATRSSGDGGLHVAEGCPTEAGAAAAGGGGGEGGADQGAAAGLNAAAAAATDTVRTPADTATQPLPSLHPRPGEARAARGRRAPASLIRHGLPRTASAVKARTGKSPGRTTANNPSVTQTQPVDLEGATGTDSAIPQLPQQEQQFTMPVAADGGAAVSGLAAEQMPAGDTAAAAATAERLLGKEYPSASTSPEEEPMCGQRQSFHCAHSDADKESGSGLGTGRQAAPGEGGPAAEATGAQHEHEQGEGAAAAAVGPKLKDQEAQGGGPADGRKATAVQEQQRNSPAHGPRLMFASQGIQTSQCLLDANHRSPAVQQQQPEGVADRHTVGVQTSQVPGPPPAAAATSSTPQSVAPAAAAADESARALTPAGVSFAAAATAATATGAEAQLQPPVPTGSQGGRSAAPSHGRVTSSKGGVPLEALRAWLPRGKCARLVALAAPQDCLDVRHSAAGITSWPDVAAAVLVHLNSAAPLPPPPQACRAARAAAAGARALRAAAGSGEEAAWQDYWLPVRVPSSIHDTDRLAGELPMARDVLGGPSPQSLVTDRPGALPRSAAAAGAMGAEVAQGSHSGCSVAGPQGQLDLAAAGDLAHMNQASAGESAEAPHAEVWDGAEAAAEEAAEAEASGPETGEGGAAEGAAEVAATSGAGDAALTDGQERQSQGYAQPFVTPPRQLTEDEFALMSAPPDFFTQPLTQPF